MTQTHRVTFDLSSHTLQGLYTTDVFAVGRDGASGRYNELYLGDDIRYAPNATGHVGDAYWQAYVSPSANHRRVVFAPKDHGDFVYYSASRWASNMMGVIRVTSASRARKRDFALHEKYKYTHCGTPAS